MRERRKRERESNDDGELLQLLAPSLSLSLLLDAVYKDSSIEWISVSGVVTNSIDYDVNIIYYPASQNYT